jgi:hypothetical protein
MELVGASEVAQTILSTKNYSRPYLREQQATLDKLATMIEEINEKHADIIEAQNGGIKPSKAPAKLTQSDVVRLEAVSHEIAEDLYRPKPPFRKGMDGDVAHSNVMEAMDAVMSLLDPSGEPREKDVITAKRRRQHFTDEAGLASRA